MKKEIIISLSKTFEESAYEQDGVEYWLARDLQVLLEYSEGGYWGQSRMLTI